MKTVCYYCEKEFELNSDDITVELESDHPYIAVVVCVKCPHCEEAEKRILTLDDFLQEHGVEE